SPRWKTTAAYESGAVRKMGGLRGRAWDENARHRSVGSPVRPCCTDLAWIRLCPTMSRGETDWQHSQPVPWQTPPGGLDVPAMVVDSDGYKRGHMAGKVGVQGAG